MDNAELAIGIDLGTTNSLIAVWKDGAAQLIPNKFGEYLTPSIISMDENNHILVGKPAVSRRTSHPDKTAALFKRAMGSNTNWRLGSDTFNAPELSSLVLRSLKEDAEEFLQRPIKDVVISVPAYFSDEQRKHTRLAAELAGLNAVRLINEPSGRRRFRRQAAFPAPVGDEGHRPPRRLRPADERGESLVLFLSS